MGLSTVPSTMIRAHYHRAHCHFNGGTITAARPCLDARAYARRVPRDAHRRVVEALAGAQVEVLLVDRRGDLGDAALVADDAARQDEGLGKGSEVVDGEDVLAIADADHCDLAAADEDA